MNGLKYFFYFIIFLVANVFLFGIEGMGGLMGSLLRVLFCWDVRCW